jgi:predicted DNA-binding transcriptional regulator YafY
VQRSERLIKLLELLHGQAGIDAEALAQACGASGRTLQRDLDALGDAGFPVYFDHGYHLGAPALLPAVTLSVDQALALRLAAQTAGPRSEPTTARALTVAAKKLDLALSARPPADERSTRQLALSLPVQDSRTEACTTALAEAIAERRTVRIDMASKTRRETAPRRIDPYRLLPSPSGLELLGYCHERRRIVRVPLAHMKGVSALRRRFPPVTARVLERHLHRTPGATPDVHWVRLLCRPPLVQTLRKHPPVGTLMWENGPDGSVIFTLAAPRLEDLLPWLLACGDAVEVLKPTGLRQEIWRIARALSERYASRPSPVPEPDAISTPEAPS